MDFSADALLLSTKIKTPAPRKNYIVRKALFEKLTKCTDMSVIFVRGGAGTGKTTLLSSFIHEMKLKNVCWLSLDDSNTNVYAFWLYFTTTVSTFWDDSHSFLTLIRSNMNVSHIENLLTILINRLCGEEDYYMVLDDVQYIKDEALVRTFEFFINAMPSNFHLFMLSRENPPVYLGQLAMSGRLLLIDGKQMQITPDEGIAFLKNTLQLKSSEEELEQLNTYAEGWIGGLQLVAAVRTTGKCSGNMLFSGEGIAVEYLTREIFESLTSEEKDFLIKTGILSYFNVQICLRIFDNFKASDFTRMIDGFISRNLFVACTDEQNGTYRYHNIFSDYLIQQFNRLPEKARKEFYIKSAAAFEEIGDFEEALREFSAAEDYDDIIRIAKTVDGGIEIWGYLDKVPVNQLISDADLASQCFLYDLSNLNINRCRLLFDQFREKYGDSDIFRAMQFAESYFHQSDNILPQYHALTAEQINRLNFRPIAKAMILVENSAALVALMRYEDAEDCIRTAINTCAGENIYVDFFAYNSLAQIYEETGNLNKSLSCYAQSKSLFKSPPMALGIGNNYYFGLAGVYMRRMELDKAAKALEKAQSFLDQQRAHTDIIDLTLSHHLAEMKFLSGDDNGGAAYVKRILSAYPSFSLITLARLIHELDCAKKLPPNLAEKFLDELESTKNYKSQPFMRLVRSRLLFKRGETEEAFKETDEMLIFSRLHKNKLRLVEAGLLKIFMLLHSYEQADKQLELINLLRETIHYACEDRILMPFYLDRSSLLPLLSKLCSQAKGKNSLTPMEAAFMQDIMAICNSLTPAVKESGLLSARELEVLEELSQGMTNRAIAKKLCIAPSTVNSHVLSIYGKLGVSSRMMAVDKGRKKGLIQ